MMNINRYVCRFRREVRYSNVRSLSSTPHQEVQSIKKFAAVLFSAFIFIGPCPVAAQSSEHCLPAAPAQALVFSTSEQVEVLFAASKRPRTEVPADIVIEWTVRVRDAAGNIIGSSTEEAALRGIVRFGISALSGQLSINGSHIGSVPIENDRVALRLDVCRATSGRNPATGEAIHISARALSTSGRLRVLDLVTGVTHASEVIDVHTVGQSDWTTLPDSN